ncbi:MAG: hypothetical protein QOK02_6210 [Mycobacterium sp.]|nr:hypothetical protein [Mycobacterium sp.]
MSHPVTGLTHGDSRPVRRAGALVLLGVFTWLVVVLEGERHRLEWQAGGRLAWSLTILAAVALIARGIFLGRPVTAAHAGVAGALVLAGLGAHLLSLDAPGNVVIACAGAALTWPTRARPQPDALPAIWRLVDATHGDPLAPFAMQSRKTPYFSSDGTAMLAYCSRFGFAAVSGDPIGDAVRFPDLVRDFAAECDARGWRIIVLGCSAARVGLWTDEQRVGQSLRAIPFGRDVVIDVAHFAMAGRRYRNLRQGVQRTRNLGVTTELVAEADLDDGTRAELADVMRDSHGGVRTERGFSMILDGALEGRYPGVLLMIARDRGGRVQAFHRYVVAGGGNDVSLDVPLRRRNAPNGVDERLCTDMVDWARRHGVQRLSLAFAAFPDIFEESHRGALHRVYYGLIHLGDGLIRLESLYRYLRKYHALGEARYVLLSLHYVVSALVVLVSLEFLPHRRCNRRTDQSVLRHCLPADAARTVGPPGERTSDTCGPRPGQRATSATDVVQVSTWPSGRRGVDGEPQADAQMAGPKPKRIDRHPRRPQPFG